MTSQLSQISASAHDVLEAIRKQGLLLATVESCTGGMIAAAITAIPGSSSVLERGFVTYSNKAKTELVGVPETLINLHGAVSKPVAIAMAEGALKVAPVDIAVSITGIAGPDGGTPEKPVGLVHMAVARKGYPTVHEVHEFGPNDRDSVRNLATHAALNLLRAQV